MFLSPGRPPLVLPLPITRPNDPLVGLMTGLSRFAMFGKLNASARSCTRLLLDDPNVFRSAMSQFCVPGPRIGLRPALPKVPGAGLANAAALNQKFWSTAGPRENDGEATPELPTRFHGWFVVSPTPAR